MTPSMRRRNRDVVPDSLRRSKRSKRDDDSVGSLAALGGGASSSDATAVIRVNSHKCNVCGKGFPSHQALGGHKTCHRNKTSAAATTEIPSTSTASGEASNFACGPHPTSRRHQCSMCVMSYATGQALGGHMRKHFKGEIKSNRRRKNVESSRDGGSAVTSFADGGSGSDSGSTSRPPKFDLNSPPDSPELDLTLGL